MAKALSALANHGGGFVILGLSESENGYVEAEDRPPNLDGYNQDLLNGIVQNYCDPPFHCAVHFVLGPSGDFFPVVIVPGGHRVPVRARRDAPSRNTVQTHAIYVRKPGPRSETPQNSREWDELLARCMNNRRDEMFDQIRDLITGAVPQVDQNEEDTRLHEWTVACMDRWHNLIEPLPPNVGPRFPHGHYSIAYEIIGERQAIQPAQLPEVLRESVVRHTGWPPFWYPTRHGIEPYLNDGAVECWIGGDPQAAPEDRDADHSDFWRISPEGLAFLLRGLQEDSLEARLGARNPVAPGTVFDLTLPVWRVGEALLQSARLAENLFNGPSTIRFVVEYKGLEGRELKCINGRRHVFEGRRSRQDAISLTTHIEAQSIGPNLPEILHPMLSPLYALFDFFELSIDLVADELGRLREGRF